MTGSGLTHGLAFTSEMEGGGQEGHEIVELGNGPARPDTCQPVLARQILRAVRFCHHGLLEVHGGSGQVAGLQMLWRQSEGGWSHGGRPCHIEKPKLWQQKAPSGCLGFTEANEVVQFDKLEHGCSGGAWNLVGLAKARCCLVA